MWTLAEYLVPKIEPKTFLGNCLMESVFLCRIS